MGGTKIPVSLRRIGTGEDFGYSLLAHEEEIEREQYRLSDKEFDLVTADSDKFQPPLPLLRFPMKTGDSWEWKGTMKEGETDRPTTARITSFSTDLVLANLHNQAVKIVADLSISSGTPVPAQRTLTFWFTAEGGVVKREFGAGSARMPAEPSE
jgi:hypothetical protein